MQGERIREVMRVMGWNNTDLCRAIVSRGCPLTVQAIAKWLNGSTQNIKGEYFIALEDLTGYSARWLIEGKGNKKLKDKHPLDAFKKDFDEANSMSQEIVLNMLENLKNYKRESDYERTDARAADTGKQ